MKDEIKEILELYKNKDIEYYNLVNDLGYDKLLDYTTNLQEENERLKEDIRKDEVYFKTFELAEECDQKQDIIDDYKLRNKKAIEYIKEKARNNCWIDQYEANDLINILQGSDKDE